MIYALTPGTISPGYILRKSTLLKLLKNPLQGTVHKKHYFSLISTLSLKYLAKISFNQKMTQLSCSP